MDGATWRVNAAVSSVPRPARPATAKAPASSAAQATIAIAGRRRARPQRVSMTARAVARIVAEAEGISAIQYADRAK
jgi:hypothetical protein